MGGNAGNLDHLHADLREYVNYGASTSKRLARGLFHAMMRFGPKLDREQLLLSRFVGIATELFAMSATCAFAQWPRSTPGEPAAEVLSLAHYFCRSARFADRSSLCRHEPQRRSTRLRSHAGVARRQTRVSAQRDCVGSTRVSRAGGVRL